MRLAIQPSVLFFTFFVGAAHADEGWKKVTEKDGVLVEARQVEGSRVREVRAVTTIAASPEACYAVVHAFEDYPRTMPYVKESRVLKRDGDAVLWAYSRVEAPLVSARDYSVRVTTTRRPDGEIRMAWVLDDSLGPAPQKGVVRVPVNDGSWTFVPGDGGATTRATYRLLTDPGGSVTTWIADQANKTAVPDVLRSVRKAATGGGKK
jgi:hypothetical protein